MTKVGEVTGIRVPSPAPIPCTKTVLPAPSGPTRTTRSPGRATAATAAPSSRIASGVATTSSRAKVVIGRSSRPPADQRRRQREIGVQGLHRLAVRPVAQRAGGGGGRQGPPPGDVVHPPSHLAEQELPRSSAPRLQAPGDRG